MSMRSGCGRRHQLLVGRRVPGRDRGSARRGSMLGVVWFGAHSEFLNAQAINDGVQLVTRIAIESRSGSLDDRWSGGPLRDRRAAALAV